MRIKTKSPKQPIVKKRTYDVYKLPRNETVILNVLPGIYGYDYFISMAGKADVKQKRYAANIFMDGTYKVWTFGSFIAEQLLNFYIYKELKEEAMITVQVTHCYNERFPKDSYYDISFRDSGQRPDKPARNAKEFAQEKHHLKL